MDLIIDPFIVYSCINETFFYHFNQGVTMERENIITGQIVLRESSEKTPTGDNTDRQLMSIVGVIAVPKNFKLKGEHKYTIAGKKQENGLLGLFQMVDPDFGRMSPEFKEINITLFPETEEDISDETIGQSLGGITTSHRRWRV